MAYVNYRKIEFKIDFRILEIHPKLLVKKQKLKSTEF